MKSIAYWSGVLLLGLLIGVGSALQALKQGRASAVAVGPWGTATTFGSVDADMYTRARVALFGLLALDKKETIYYTAMEDSDGAPLSGDCTYRIEGRDLAARWWSVTAYGPDSFLIPNEANVFSFAKTTVKREADESYVVRVSASRQEGNWLPVKADQSFDLTARFYNPDASVADDPASAELPRLVKESCR